MNGKPPAFHVPAHTLLCVTYGSGVRAGSGKSTASSMPGDGGNASVLANRKPSTFHYLPAHNRATVGDVR